MRSGFYTLSAIVVFGFYSKLKLLQKLQPSYSEI